MEDRKIYRGRCKICNKEIVGLTDNQVKWLLNVHKMTHDNEKNIESGTNEEYGKIR